MATQVLLRLTTSTSSIVVEVVAAAMMSKPFVDHCPNHLHNRFSFGCRSHTSTPTIICVVLQPSEIHSLISRRTTSAIQLILIDLNWQVFAKNVNSQGQSTSFGRQVHLEKVSLVPTCGNHQLGIPSTGY